jgi:hypothetical protein
VSTTREHPLSQNPGQYQWWGEFIPPSEALSTFSPNLSDYDMDMDDSGANAEVAQQSKIMRLRSEMHAIADRFAALDLELKTELRKSGYSDDSAYFSSAASVASTVGSKRRRVDFSEHRAESILEERETT